MEHHHLVALEHDGLPIDCSISDHAPTRHGIIHNGLEPIFG